MLRVSFLVLILFAACKPKQEPEPEPTPSGPPARGMSVTKMEDPGEETDDGGAGRLENASGRAGGSEGPTASGASDAGTVDAARFGGDGSPAHRDEEGRIRGPGGPVFMGRGDECNAERDHCLREGVWFAVGNLVAGKLYRAVPVFEFEDKWYNWRGKEESFAMRFKTKVGTRQTLHAGDPVIWFIDENASKKFVDNEYDALTSTRWEAGVIESIEGDQIRVKGWTYGMVPIDTTRVILETKRQ